MSSTIALIIIGVSVLFILGIKFLSSPKTARSGNLVAAAGMLVALLVLQKTGGDKISLPRALGRTQKLDAQNEQDRDAD